MGSEQISGRFFSVLSSFGLSKAILSATVHFASHQRFWFGRCVHAWTAVSSIIFCFGSGKMPQGTIKKLTDKGFGFIEGERGDIFFHHSSVEGTAYESLREGQVGDYNEGQGPKGPRAENVTVVS